MDSIQRQALRAQLAAPGKPWSPELWDMVSGCIVRAFGTGEPFAAFYDRMRAALEEQERRALQEAA